MCCSQHRSLQFVLEERHSYQNYVSLQIQTDYEQLGEMDLSGAK